jgi:hypothetical protein
MRIRVVRQPVGHIEGFDLSRFHPGVLYDVGTELASVMLSEGWAEPAADDPAEAMPRPDVSNPQAEEARRDSDGLRDGEARPRERR